MHAITVKFLPLARTFARQIIPPVLATLIAALLIAGFNRAFSSHLVQPRMAALHSVTGEPTRPIVYATPREREEMPATDITLAPDVAKPEHIFAKDDAREAGKDEPSFKVASAPAAAVAAPAPAPVPAQPRVVRKPDAQRTEQVIERRVEPRVAAVPLVVGPAPAMVVAPGPALPPPPIVARPVGPMMGPVAQEPPPVITARPMVTAPDRPRQAQAPYPGYEPRAPYEQAQADDYAPPREPRPLERFVDSLKPSSIFNRMREFGDRIEAAGNEILPSIRQ
jgi:hypothetical protein